MRWEPLGEAGFLLRDLGAPAFQIATWLNSKKPLGLIEAVASYETVGIYTETGFNPADIELPNDFAAYEPRHHRIPVCYEMGEDLEATAKLLGLSVNELIACHTSAEYTCYAVGFCPGFGYLGYLPEAMRGVLRRPLPRTRVEPGSVGITGKQTAVYPLPRPGGWVLIGRTPLTLVDVADEYFPIQAGDSVRFERIGMDDFHALKGEWL